MGDFGKGHEAQQRPSYRSLFGDRPPGLSYQLQGGVIVVGSVAVSFAVLVSPPPDTVAVFVTDEGAVVATFTVRVIEG
jgi:hypothetical protein